MVRTQLQMVAKSLPPVPAQIPANPEKPEAVHNPRACRQRTPNWPKRYAARAKDGHS